MNDHYQEILAQAASDVAHFRGLTFSGNRNGIRISARLTLSKGRPAIRLVETLNNRESTREIAWDLWPDQVRKLLVQEHTFLHVRRDDGDWHVKITRKGHVLLSRGKPTAGSDQSTPHDRGKNYALTPSNAGAFLNSLDVLDEQGRIRPSMQAKYRQINGFLSLLEPILPEKPPHPYHICDCGCGSAHLSFAIYHYLNQVLNWPASLVGVDRNAELIQKNTAWRDRLDWPGLSFETVDLSRYNPVDPPNLVLSLHACDTATDIALARGVEWKAGIIIAAPCCQHELHRKIESDSFQGLLRHGILRERLADLVTDALRAAALRLCGYSVKVIEFSAPSDTGRNLMIRAVRTNRPPEPAATQEYHALKSFWNITPEIERLLRASVPTVFD